MWFLIYIGLNVLLFDIYFVYSTEISCNTTVMKMTVILMSTHSGIHELTDLQQTKPTKVVRSN